VPTELDIAQRVRVASTAATFSAPLLAAENVHRLLGQGEAVAHVLRGVSISIRQGQYVSIVGQSGSGKSTLLYLLGGLDRPDVRDAGGATYEPASRVLIAGRATSGMGDAELARLRNEKIGFVFQFHYLLKEFTAQENVALPMLKLGRLGRGEAMQRASDLLARLGLGGKARRRANRLSGGEQQRVAIARALANEPAALLADEPTGNLDSTTGEEIMELLRELGAGGLTIVLITHDVGIAGTAPRLVRLRDGRIDTGAPARATLEIS
jgi:ABC-type lipoprotein export system ATPase subunit